MNMTKEQAFGLGKKVMEDIGFDYDANTEISLRYIEKGDYEKNNRWLVSFPYGIEDFGKYIHAHLSINDDLQKAARISYRNGSVSLGYDEENDKYFVEEQRP